MNKTYDLLILGGGVSACIFVSSIISKGFKGKIVIIENGRDLGGRFTTRKSFKNKGFQLNHGTANFNIINNNNDKLLNDFLSNLIKRNLIRLDDSLFFELDKNRDLLTFTENPFYKGDVFVPIFSMSYLLNKLIGDAVKNNQIDLFFNTLITDLIFLENNWFAYSQDGIVFNAKFVVSSSNLILHKRSTEIFKKNDIPIRDAIPKGQNKIIDNLINLVNKQNYVVRVNYLIYTNQNYKYNNLSKKQNVHFILNSKAESIFGFERIIFQRQSSEKIGIVIHTRKQLIDLSNYDKNFSNDELVDNFNHIFQHSNLINKLVDYEDISIMRWRASQPEGLRIPKGLQLCEEYKLAFCGDWLDYSGFGRVEGAILSALHLSKNVMQVF
ncbi:MAG: hypothetical protein CMK49_03335 [Prochlorococcus sp. SP3034]|nr:hypothetical protein [Prochlorococcus sp. SP3034]|tara:strand:+ start:14284 stop:15432 length:1149 start_codon:yes stop_codon:yes gene_type:complete